MKILKLLFLVVIISVVVSMCMDDNEMTVNSDGNSSTHQDDDTQDDVVTDYSHIVVPITQKGFPKTYKTWGKKWIDDINATMPLAVNHIAKSEKCDEPIDVSISDNRSKPKKEVVFFVDCKNGERFFISQEELKSNTMVEAESEKLAEAHKYIRPCVDAIKQQLNYPATFDEKTLSIRAYKGTSGNVVVEVPFTAKNGFGVEIENMGKCVIDTQNNSTVEIF
ncbi:hypothetical protein [Moraxella bovoculi]|uniref:Lipoprotein n=1 Tax=Moraxella bovoculi 237 TaxID=743974 RepID=A0A066UFG0_9GAMM|nr:hypothetical protein [Moraxella bovoculi]ALT07399.1 hypothetical protein AAX08_02040 [Moraxella bovoculi]KDN26136.1 hypothetical protein MBO_00160 [Moraxella bovoculi 237]